MFGSDILDAAIGMVFVYLLLSLVCSALGELLEGLLKNRAKDLERGLRELLHDSDGTGMVKRIYEHPLINGLFSGAYDPTRTGNLPSYIPAKTFAMALMDIVAPTAPAGGTPAVPGSGGTGVAPAPSPVPDPVVKAVKALAEAAGPDIAQARANVETWFNASMERVAGWYKRRSQTVIFCVGLALALVVNADSIAIATGLANDKAARDSLVAAAQTYAQQNQSGLPNSGSADQKIKDNLNTISGIGLPIGWEKRETETVPGRIPEGLWGWVLKVIGCLVTAAATSLGAPFWFDLLNKFITVRSTIKPKEQTAPTS